MRYTVQILSRFVLRFTFTFFKVWATFWAKVSFYIHEVVVSEKNFYFHEEYHGIIGPSLFTCTFLFIFHFKES